MRRLVHSPLLQVMMGPGCQLSLLRLHSYELAGALLGSLHEVSDATSCAQFDFRFIFAYDLRYGCATGDRALLIAACIIAAIRLRGEPIRPSPKLTATVAESVALARTVLRELQRA
jgi:hypothetical protein